MNLTHYYRSAKRREKKKEKKKMEKNQPKEEEEKAPATLFDDSLFESMNTDITTSMSSPSRDSADLSGKSPSQNTDA